MRPRSKETAGIRFTHGWVVLILFICSILFFYDLFQGRYLLTERDLAPYFIPPRFFWAESIKQGDFPLWNPYQFTGHPFLANPQNATLYPLHFIFFLLPFDFAFNAIIILHFFLGGLFTYFLVRDLRVRPLGSLLSGLIFMLGGYLLSVHSLLSVLLSVIWTPLIVLFFLKALARPGLRNEILTALFLTLSFLGGGIEIVYGNFLALLVMVFVLKLRPESREGFLIRKRTSRGFGENRSMGLWPGLRSLLLVWVTFTLLSSIQLVPFLELWANSIRGKGLSYQEATLWSFSPKDLVLFFFPDAYGYFLDIKKYWVNQCWLKTLYTGGLPFLLAVFYFMFGKERKLFIALMVFSLFLSFGGHNPLYPCVFRFIPFFNGIRYPVKFLYLFILCLSIVAGLGFQSLTDLSREQGHTRLKKALFMFSLAFGMLLLLLILGYDSIYRFFKLRGMDFPDFNYLFVNLHHAKRLLFYLTLFCLLLRVGFEAKWKTWAGMLVLFSLTADLFGNMGYYGFEKARDYFRKTKIQEIVAADRGPFRSFSTPRTISTETPILIKADSSLWFLKEKHLPSLNLIHRIHDLWGNEVIRLERGDALYRTLISIPSVLATNLIDLYSVKYIISVTPLGEDPRYELVDARLEGLEGRAEDLLRESTIKLYRKKDALPRAWLVRNSRTQDPKALISSLASEAFSPREEVLLEENCAFQVRPLNMGQKEKEGREGVEFLSESNNRLKLLVRTDEDRWLVLSETYFPGWKAYVTRIEKGLRTERQRKPILRANYHFRAIPLEPGEYEVEFYYDPASFKIGAAITLISVLGMIGGFVRNRIRKKNPCRLRDRLPRRWSSPS